MLISTDKPAITSKAFNTSSDVEIKEKYIDKELDIFDVVLTLQKSWGMIVGAVTVCLLIAAAYLIVQVPSMQVSIPIELPSEKSLVLFNLPAVNLGDSNRMSLPENQLVSAEFIAGSILKRVSAVFETTAKPILHGGILKIDMKPVKSSVYSLDMTIKGSSQPVSNEALSKVLEEAFEQIAADLQTRVVQQLENRLMQVDQARNRLRQITIQGMKNRIFVREKELELKRLTLSNKLKALQELKQQENSQTLKALHKLASARRQDRIMVLQEALKIAEQLGIENMDSKDAAGQLLYLRGKKVLSAELKELQNQTNDANIVPEIRALEEDLDISDFNGRHEVSRTRQNEDRYGAEIPSIKAQLAQLENDEELLALKRNVSRPDLIDYYINDLQVLESDSFQVNRLKLILKDLKLLDSMPLQTTYSTSFLKMAITLLIGGILGIMIGTMLSHFQRNWQSYNHSNASAIRPVRDD